MSFIGLLRHGAVEGGEVYRGRTDDPLSATGHLQMREAMVGLSQWDRIISSPLQRCAAFAGDFAHQYGIPFTLEPGLQEIDFGEWEGCSAAELLQTSPEALTKFWQDPLHNAPPGGESLIQFNHRVVTTWETLHQGNQNQRLLLVTHAGVIRMLLCQLQGWSLNRLWEIEVKHAALLGLLITQRTLKRLFTSRGSIIAWLAESS
jgi:alpha-ribazole phosphatase